MRPYKCAQCGKVIMGLGYIMQHIDREHLDKQHTPTHKITKCKAQDKISDKISKQTNVKINR